MKRGGVYFYLLLLPAAGTLVILDVPSALWYVPGVNNRVKGESERIASSHPGPCRCVRKRGRTYWSKGKKRASFILLYSKGRAELFQWCGFFFRRGVVVVVVVVVVITI